MRRVLRYIVICLFVLFASHMLYAAEVGITGEGNSAAKFNWGKKISAQIRDMLLPDALAVLLKDTGVGCKVYPDVAQLKVTADFKNVSLQKALAELERGSGTFIVLISDSISKAGDSWVTGAHTRVDVQKRSNQTAQDRSKGNKTEATVTQVKNEDVVVPKGAHAIRLNYYRSKEMLEALGVPNWRDILQGRTSEWTAASGLLPDTLPKGITSIAVQQDYESKVLFVKGEDAAVAELTKLVTKKDDEARQPRKVNIHITQYALGSVIPESIEFDDSQNHMLRTAGSTESKLDVLTAELHGKGIEPKIDANITTFNGFTVGIKGSGDDGISSMLPSDIDLQVQPRLHPEDSSVQLQVTNTNRVIYGVEINGESPVPAISSTTFVSRSTQGEAMLFLELQDTGNVLTIVKPTW